MIRLVLAALIGAALGKERAVSKHSAGVRTMSLVSLGAAVFTVCSGYGFSNFPKVDASRMAANVASGVGFVGAGVITTSMREQNGSSSFPNNTVHGLTTAATIWLSAAVGVACGVGLLRVATTAALTTICILCMGRKTKEEFPSLEYDDVERKEQYPLVGNTDEGNPKITNSQNSYDVNGDDSDSEIHRSGHPDDGGRDLSSHQSEIAEARTAYVPEEAAEIGKDRSNSTISDDFDDVSSKLVEEILRSACRYDNSTVAVLVDRVLSQAEETGRFSERAVGSRERRRPSSSDSELLP
jgi:putative Mg2+ transporter-C (MgtC) family protein